eukprot:jgi/Astpho2/3927/Aster-01109
MEREDDEVLYRFQEGGGRPQIERKRKKALPLSRPILTRLVVLGMLGIFFWQETYLIRRGQVYRLFLSSLVHVNLLHLLANSLALHEFGKDLERHVGSVNMAAILLASAVGSGLAATHFGLGPSAVPLGASGLVTGVLGAVVMLSLLWKELRDQDLAGTAAVGVAVAFLLGHFVPLLDNRWVSPDEGRYEVMIV